MRRFSLILACICAFALSGAARPAFAQTSVALHSGWQICYPIVATSDAGATSEASAAQDCANPRSALWQEAASARDRPERDSTQSATRLWQRVALPALPACPEPVLYLSVVNVSFRAFLDGRPIYAFGDIERGRAGFAGRPFHIIPLPLHTAGGPTPGGAPAAQAGPRWFTVEVWSDFRDIGVAEGDNLLGCRAEMLQSIVRRDMSRFMIGVIALALGCGSLFLFARRRSESVYLAFALLCLAVGAYFIANRTLRLQHILWPDAILWYRLEHISQYCLVPALSFFYRQVAPDSQPLRITAIVAALIALCFMLINLVWLPAYVTFGAHLYVMLALAVLWGLYLFPHTLRHGPPETRVAAIGTLIFFLVGFGDLLWALGFAPWWPGQLAPYGFFVLLVATGATVFQRYLRIRADLRVAHGKLQAYAQGLEEQVADRTAELRRTLAEVSQLKEQQDGDYLLISRMLSPMIRARVARGSLQVDYLVSQHKTFEFRGMGGELGGDLCIAEPIRVGDEPYVVWLNADAMGKSVQGAGGALVLAVAFRAFLHLSADGQAPLRGRAPAEWLLRLTEELQRVFRPFEGRMLVTLIVGLVHETSGQVYAINAGHPAAVLLRDGRASPVFEARMEAIGAPDAAPASAPEYAATASDQPPPAFVPESAVAELRLRPDDRLIAGSDGRDDLRQRHGAGLRMVDNDPARFLRIVEAERGDLDRIAEKLRAAGELVDDLSLLRLSLRA